MRQLQNDCSISNVKGVAIRPVNITFVEMFTLILVKIDLSWILHTGLPNSLEGFVHMKVNIGCLLTRYS